MMLCSFGIELSQLQVVLAFLPDLVSYLLGVGILETVVAAAKSSSSYCSHIVDLGGSSILDYTCWSRGVFAFDSC